MGNSCCSGAPKKVTDDMEKPDDHVVPEVKFPKTFLRTYEKKLHNKTSASKKFVVVFDILTCLHKKNKKTDFLPNLKINFFFFRMLYEFCSNAVNTAALVVLLGSQA